jgi:nucleoside-diphosphate-sugar epimerase
MSDRMLVTGSDGFVGRHVVATLTRAGAEMIEVAHRWRDIRDLDDRLGDGPIARCIHLGWYAAPIDYLIARDANLRSLWDSIALVDLLAARGCRHLVVAGTSAEYGPRERPINEDDPVRPWSVYGATKAAFSTLLESSWRPPGMGVAWARLFNVTGPGESPERLIPTVAMSLLRGHAVDLSSGHQVRDFLDVRDVAAALVALSASGADGPFNVSSGDGIALRTLLTQIGTVLGRVDLLRFGAKGYPDHDASYLVGDNARLRKATGWRRRISTDEMLDTVAGYWRARDGIEDRRG